MFGLEEVLVALRTEARLGEVRSMLKFELKLRRRNIATEELLADLRRVAVKADSASITRSVYDQFGQFGATTILRKFGTWNKALATAGLGINNRLNIPNEELFENLATVWTTLGRQPIGNDINKASGLSCFSLGTYEKRFGAWNKSLLAFMQFIELPSEQSTGAKTISKRSAGIARRTKRKVNWRLRAGVLIRDNCICGMCGASPAKDPNVTLHVDHIVAWNNGGETEIANLRTLCEVCNVGKSDQ